MISIVFALVLVSFSLNIGQKQVQNINKNKNNFATDPLEIIYAKYEFLANGSILINEISEDLHYQWFDILDQTKFPQLYKNKDEHSESFRLIENDSIIPLLNVSQHIQFDASKCNLLNKAITDVQDYGLYGFSTYIHEGADIQPSIIYGIISVHEVRVMHSTGTSETYFEKLGCVSNEYYQYELGIELNGVVSSECISNDAIIPGHYESSSQTIPTKPTICDDNQSEIVKYLQGYKYGQILGIGQEDLKLYLTRVGPVVGSIIYLLDDGDTTTNGEVVFLGWEKVAKKQYWIIARQIKEQVYSQSGLYDSYYYEAEKIPFDWPSRAIDSQYFGNLLFKDVYNPIVEPTYCTDASDATVTKDSCICTKDNYPINCKCPTTSEEIVGIPEDRCKCTQSDDFRVECKTASDVDEQSGLVEDKVRGIVEWFKKNWKLIAFVAVCVVGGYIIIAVIVSLVFCVVKFKQSQKVKREQEMLLNQYVADEYNQYANIQR